MRVYRLVYELVGSLIKLAAYMHERVMGNVRKELLYFGEFFFKCRFLYLISPFDLPQIELLNHAYLILYVAKCSIYSSLHLAQRLNKCFIFSKIIRPLANV